MKFNFKSRDNKGREVIGVRDAGDRFSLARQLRAEGLVVISAEPYAEPSRFERQAKRLWWRHVSLKDKIMFANNLSAMLGAGLSLARGLGVLERQTTAHFFKSVVQSVGEQVSRGQGLAQALGVWPAIFPSVFVAMVAAGEESGNLPQALAAVAEQLGKSYDLRRKIRGAMMYPLVVLGAIIIIGTLLMIFVVPTLVETFEDLKVTLPLSTRIIIATSRAFTNHPLIILSAVLSLIFFATTFIRTTSGRRILHWLWLRLPIIGTISKEINAAIIMRTIASLIASGVSMVETVRVTSRVVANVHYQEALTKMIGQIEKGLTLSTLFRARTDLFLVMVGELAEVGEETGNLSAMLLRGAVFFEGEVDQQTKNISTLVEPILLLLVGAGVGFFAVAMIGPIYSLTAAL